MSQPIPFKDDDGPDTDPAILEMWRQCRAKPDSEIARRALFILHEFMLERTGWRYWLYRWYHNDEPLRNDAARLLKESGYQFMKPIGSRSIAEDM